MRTGREDNERREGRPTKQEQKLIFIIDQVL
jgi:hypothetical protein